MNILLMYPNDPNRPWYFYHSCERSLRKKYRVETFDLLKVPFCIPLPFLRKYGIQFYKGKRVDVRSVILQCKEKPEVIIQVEGPGFHNLKGYKNLKIPTAYWAIESHIPIALDFHKNIIKDFDYVFVAMKDYINAYKEIHDNVFWLPLAADPEIHKRYDLPRVFDLGYVGGISSNPPKMYKDKMRLLSSLSQKYSSLFVNNVWGEDVGKVYSLSKIGFNRSISGASQLPMRVFEVMSCGTMLLTDRLGNGLEELFTDRKHLALYETEEEIHELILYYLENEEERARIALTGQKEVHEKHTYDLRMRTMLELMGF